MVREKRLKQVVLKIVEKIKKEYKPEKIILFGSYAYGKPDRDSDLDLLIIKQTFKPFRKRWVEVYNLVSNIVTGVDFCPFVITPEELEKRLQRGDQFFQEITERGECLYAK